MEIGAFLHDALDGGGVNLAIRARHEQHLGTAGEKFGCAALGGFHMRVFMAHDAVVGLAERGQRERIGGGAVEDKEHFALGLEKFADEVGGALRPGIVAVIGRGPVIGFGERGEGFGADAGDVVAGKMKARIRFKSHARKF